MASLSRPLREDFFLPSALRSGSYVCSQLLCIDPYSPALPLNPCFASCLGPSRSFSQTCMISCSQVKGENPSSKGFHLLATIYLLAFSLSFLSEWQSSIVCWEQTIPRACLLWEQRVSSPSALENDGGAWPRCWWTTVKGCFFLCEAV